MKKKITGLGIIGILLLMSYMSISTMAMELKQTDNSGQPEQHIASLGDDFSIKIRSFGYGVSVRVNSLTGETEDVHYYVKYDFRTDRKDREDENTERVGPGQEGRYSYWYFRVERANVYVEVTIGSQTVTKSGFARFGLVFLF